jgi:glycogen debranching enzyme
MRLDSQVLGDLPRSSAIEWLQTDGLGGFAMGTAAGMNTRRYHGWCVALRPVVERHLLVSRLEESCEGIELAVNQYPGVVHPSGHRYLVGFVAQPCPTWTWDLGGGLTVTKELWLPRGQQALCVRYTASRPCSLKVRPLLAFRDYHSLQRGNEALDRRWVEQGRLITLRPYAGLPEVELAHTGEATHDGEGWYWNTEYELERQRGLDFREDLWCLGTVTLKLEPQGRLTFSLKPQGPLPEPVAVDPADVFRARRADARATIIAGYPWFTDWGRDTMISLPGLLIGRGHLDEAEQVVRAFVAHLDQGLLPNRFPDRGERPEYNTADATLWLFQAVDALIEAGAGTAFLRDGFFEQAQEIVAWHERGTHFDIHVDASDGLLVNGPQTTWMDAVVDGRPVTPRAGKAVEINALWFNALKLLEGWARRLGRAQLAAEYGAKAARVAGAFRLAFMDEAGWLHDAVGDRSFRPNQLLAASLQHSPLTVIEAQGVVRACELRLVTPFGLRTLAPGEKGYRGRYDKDPVSRDAAYHQGTVWPWLIGPFVDASLRAFGSEPETLGRLRQLLQPLWGLLEQNGTLPEVFDGDPPHRWGGTWAQAWSVAEVLRAWKRVT